ncbi:MAG: heme exporter protein CcmB [Nitrospinota bacterium]
MNSFNRSLKTILLKDLKTELRSREFLSTTFMFALLVIVIFNFAFSLTSENKPALSAGILWIAFLFAGTLGLGRSFQVEVENDCIHGLTLAPVDRTALYWAKCMGNLAFLAAVQAVIIPVYIVLYNINVMEFFFRQSAVFLLGDIGFIALGTLVSAIAVNLRARELLLPVLLLPLLIPLIIFAASASSALINGPDMALFESRIKFVAAFDVIFFVASSLVFDYIVDEL